MKKLILLVFVGIFALLPLQAEAGVSSYQKTLACQEKTWKQWKKDKFCMKLLKKQHHPNPTDKQNKIWNGKSWKKALYTGHLNAQA